MSSSGEVTINDLTAQAAQRISKLTKQRLEGYLDDVIMSVKQPAGPNPPRYSSGPKRRHIIHEEKPVQPWQYTSGGVGRMWNKLASSAEWKKQGTGYIIFTATGYGAWHELGTKYTNPNPAFARAIKFANEQLLETKDWA